MSLIWALWDTFIGFGGFIVFLILFSKFTDAEIWPDAILTTVVTGFVQFFVFLAFIGIAAGLVVGSGCVLFFYSTSNSNSISGSLQYIHLNSRMEGMISVSQCNIIGS